MSTPNYKVLIEDQGTSSSQAVTLTYASNTIPGIVSLANVAESVAGVDNKKALTPYGLVQYMNSIRIESEGALKVFKDLEEERFIKFSFDFSDGSIIEDENGIRVADSSSYLRRLYTAELEGATNTAQISFQNNLGNEEVLVYPYRFIIKDTQNNTGYKYEVLVTRKGEDIIDFKIYEEPSADEIDIKFFQSKADKFNLSIVSGFPGSISIYSLGATGSIDPKVTFATATSPEGLPGFTEIKLKNFVNEDTKVIAGDGLIGTGDLSKDVTIAVVSMTDGIVVEEDGIKLVPVESLDSVSTTQALSANMGRALKTELDTKSNSDHMHSTTIFEQSVPSAVWNVYHGLKKFPAVTVVDSGGTIVVGDVQYIDEDRVTITFSSEFSGKAYMN